MVSFQSVILLEAMIKKKPFVVEISSIVSLLCGKLVKK
jgi:hypothetical protein